MYFEMNNEPFKFKKSKVIMTIFKILLGISLFLSFLFTSLSINEIERLMQYNERPDFKDFYLFTPNQDFFQEAQKQFPNYSGREVHNAYKLYFESIFGPLQRNGDVDLVIYNLKKYYENENYVIYTYWRPETYDLDFDYLTRQMKAGRWFENEEKELILLKGSYYQFGDSLTFVDQDKRSKTLPIVGESKGHYLLNTTNLWNYYPVNRLDQNHKSVFLLNPKSDMNTRSNLTCNDDIHTLVKFNNQNAIKRINELGTLNVIEPYATPKANNQRWDNFFYYIDEFHLYYLVLAFVFYVLADVLLYFLHKWNWQKHRWIFLGLGIVGLTVLGMIGYVFLNWAIVIYAFEIVLIIIYDIFLKKNFVHGRSYIVDLWDEEDIEI